MSNCTMPLVSVIIPVYKTEAYLEKCVRSVMMQSYRNLEIILVNDGSPDNCPAICDRLANEDKRIEVIHQDNHGVASARNSGLAKMKGDYLFFVDSDDFVEPDAINILLSISAESGADMVCGQCYCIDEDGVFLHRDYRSNAIQLFHSEEGMKHYAQLSWAPWNRLMRTSVHKDIIFPPYRIHEDEAIKFKLLSNCQLVAQVDTDTYAYRQRQGSITASQDTPRLDMFYSCKENFEWLKKNHPSVIPYFAKSVWEAALYNVGAYCKIQDWTNNNIREIASFSRANWESIFFGKNVTAAQRLRLILFNMSDWERSNSLYCRFYRAIGRM